MLLADRPEFDRQVSLICAAYNVPIGERAEAYWLAFNRLRLDDWIRMVTTVIGPDGPEKMPTVQQLWRIRKQAKAAPPRDPEAKDVLTALVEAAIDRWPLTATQRRLTWNWIARVSPGMNLARDEEPYHNAQILGVIIPQDPDDPEHYPARRLMVSDIEQVSHG